MCDCIEQIQGKIEENFKKTIQPNEEYGYTELTPTAFMFKNDNSTRLETCSVAKVIYVRTTNSGKRQEKEKHYNMAHKFCPYCGEKYGE